MGGNEVNRKISHSQSAVMKFIALLPRKYNVEGSLTADLADIICSTDFEAKLESLVKRLGNLKTADENGHTILHHLAMTMPQLKHTGYNVENVAKCVSFFVASEVDLDLDAQSEDLGNTALHYAAQFKDKYCCDALIKAGADLCVKNSAGESAISVVFRHIPNSYDIIREKLDEGISEKEEDSRNDEIKTVLLDFNVLQSKSCNDQSQWNYLTEILEDDKANRGINVIDMKHLEKVFMHPLTECFLNFRWHRVNHVYLAHLICHIIFSLTYSTYVYSLYSLVCNPLDHFASDWNGTNWVNQTIGQYIGQYHNWTYEITCNASAVWQNASAMGVTQSGFEWGPGLNPLGNTLFVTILWVTLLIFVTIYSVKEIGWIYYLRGRYFTSWENPLSILMLITFPFLTLYKTPTDEVIRIRYYQYHVAATGILFTWILNMLYIARSPFFGQYVHMMIKVSINFGKFFIAISSLLIAFATSFTIMFPREASINNLATSPLKVLSMMAGEVGYNDLVYRQLTVLKTAVNTTDHQYLDTVLIPQLFPRTTLILISIFIFIFSIIIVNLFFGIAVNDVQSIINAGLVHHKIKMTTTIPIYEKVLDQILRVLPPMLQKFIERKSLYRKTVDSNICEVDLDGYGKKKMISRSLSQQLMLAMERNLARHSIGSTSTSQIEQKLPTTLDDLMKIIERLEQRLEQNERKQEREREQLPTIVDLMKIIGRLEQRLEQNVLEKKD